MKTHAPLLPCLLGLATGIWAQGILVTPWWILPTALAGVSLAIWRLKATPLKRLRLARYNMGRLAAAVMFCAIGAFAAWIMYPPHYDLPETKILTGIVEKASDTSHGQSLLVTVDDTGGIKSILYTGPESNLHKGDRIAWHNNLKEIDDPDNLIDSRGRRFFAAQGTSWLQTIRSGNIILISHSKISPFDASRDFLAQKLEESSLGIEATAFLQSILLGDRHLLAPEDRQSFADSGVAHVLALSGLHMGMLAAVLTLLFLPLNAVGAWKWKYPLVVVFLWLYAALTGLSGPTVRACIMATFLSCAIVMERRNSAFNALCAAGIAILCANPAALGEPGFQLSFVCVASLLLFGEIFHRGRGIRRKLLSAVGACLIATAGSWAISAWWFGSFPLSFLPANLMLLPLLPFYIGIGGIYLISLCLGYDLSWLASILELGHTGALGGCKLLSSLLPPLSFSVHWAVPALWLGAIGSLAWFLNSSRRKAWGISACVLAAGAIVCIGIPEESESEGLAILNQTGRIILTDSHGGKIRKIVFPPEIHTQVSINGLKIIGADRPELPAEKTECDVLILASGWKGSVTPLLEQINPRLLVVHPSVFSFLLDDIRSEAKRLGVPVHDLRTDGPLHLHNSTK